MKVKVKRKKKSAHILQCINMNLNSMVVNQGILYLQLEKVITLLHKIVK